VCRADPSSKAVLWIVVCLIDSEASTVRRPWHTMSCSTEKNKLLPVKYKTALCLILEVSILVHDSPFYPHLLAQMLSSHFDHTDRY
jgi:hypothetical protein